MKRPPKALAGILGAAIGTLAKSLAANRYLCVSFAYGASAAGDNHTTGHLLGSAEGADGEILGPPRMPQDALNVMKPSGPDQTHPTKRPCGHPSARNRHAYKRRWLESGRFSARCPFLRSLNLIFRNLQPLPHY
jgi:hypothetical protein